MTTNLRNIPVMCNTVKVWTQMMAYVGRKGFSSSLSPITVNKAFPPGNCKVLDLGHKKGMRIIGELYSENSLMSFTQIQAQFDIAHTNTYKQTF